MKRLRRIMRYSWRYTAFKFRTRATVQILKQMLPKSANSFRKVLLQLPFIVLSQKQVTFNGE